VQSPIRVALCLVVIFFPPMSKVMSVSNASSPTAVRIERSQADEIRYMRE
jgi:hypothetical protein